MDVASASSSSVWIASASVEVRRRADQRIDTQI